MTLASRRHEYETAGLDVSDLVADPMEQWRVWFEQATDAGCVEPNAFVLSTVDDDGFPQARYLLARGADERGFSFYTNYDSDKSRQLAGHAKVGMLFTWLQLHRQVRVTGSVERLPDDESDSYFASRPRASQLGAWASPQSQPLTDRSQLDERVADMERTFSDVADVPRPVFWGGWLMRPTSFEFWQGRPSRLHDRLRYSQMGQVDAPVAADTPASEWTIERLAP